MPYYLFSMSQPDALKLVKKLDLIDVYEDYREARGEARRLRAGQHRPGVIYRVTFADNRLAAEQQLTEQRERPVLMEHER